MISCQQCHMKVKKSDWIRSLLSKRHLKIENEILLEKKKKCIGKDDELFYL